MCCEKSQHIFFVWVGAIRVPPARIILDVMKSHDRRCRSSVVMEYTCASGTLSPDSGLVGCMLSHCSTACCSLWGGVVLLSAARCSAGVEFGGGFWVGWGLGCCEKAKYSVILAN